MRLALFDLDKTILSINSGEAWVRREYALGHVSKRQAIRAALWLTRYHLGFASAESMVGDAVAQLTGALEAPLVERTASFFEELVRKSYRTGARTAIESHRRAGDRLVMLTSSTNYLSSLVAKELGFDGVLCNTLEVSNGRLTGRVVGRICFGEGKLVHAKEEAARTGLKLEDAAFYTDSFSDVAVMNAVGEPVAVHPDQRLRRQAERLRWRIANWD